MVYHRHPFFPDLATSTLGGSARRASPGRAVAAAVGGGDHRLVGRGCRQIGEHQEMIFDQGEERRRRGGLFPAATCYAHSGGSEVARKVRELARDLRLAGFFEITGGGRGSHRKFTHVRYAGAVTLSGNPGDDAKPYQEKQVKRAIEEIQE